MPVASEDALTGLGMPAQLAQLMGSNALTQAGTGTAQAGATLLRDQSIELTTSGGATAFILQDWGINVPQLVFCSSATTALVFCPVGHTLNGTLNASLSVAQNKGAMFWEYKPKFWASILTA